MILLFDPQAEELRRYPNRETAFRAALELNEYCEGHPAIMFFEVKGKSVHAEYIGRLARHFGSNEFYIRT